jgi:hypothetical protein
MHLPACLFRARAGALRQQNSARWRCALVFATHGLYVALTNHALYGEPIDWGKVSARTLARLSNTTIRNVFLPLLGLIAIEMLIRGCAMLLAIVQ